MGKTGAKPGPGPSPSFGTRTMTKPVERHDDRRSAVRVICYAARELPINDIRLILEILDLDPREGLPCDVHGRECYAVACGSDHLRGGRAVV